MEHTGWLRCEIQMIQSFKALVVINQCYSENAITLLSIVYLWLEFLFILQETSMVCNAKLMPLL